MNIAISYGVSVFIGIIAGILVSLGVEYWNKKIYKKNLLRNFLFEIDYNIKKIDIFISLLNDYRNYINGDSIYLFTGYFDLSKIVFAVSTNMFYSGQLYDILPHEDIGNYLSIATWFSLSGEMMLSNQIQQRKNNYSNTLYDNRICKQEAIMEIDFWNKLFNKTKIDFIHMRDLLERKI